MKCTTFHRDKPAVLGVDHQTREPVTFLDHLLVALINFPTAEARGTAVRK